MVGQTIAFCGLLGWAMPCEVFHEVSRAERPSQQGRKTPAFRPVGKLKHAPPSASVFHEISRADGPGQQTKASVPRRRFCGQALSSAN